MYAQNKHVRLTLHVDREMDAFHSRKKYYRPDHYMAYSNPFIAPFLPL